MTKDQRENLVLRNLIDRISDNIGEVKGDMKEMDKILKGNSKKLDYINGTVRRHKFKHFPDVFKRIESLEDQDIREEGIEIGKNKMKSSTKNTIAIVTILVTLFSVGTGMFFTVAQTLKHKIDGKMNYRDKSADALRDMKIILKKIESYELERGKKK